MKNVIFEEFDLDLIYQKLTAPSKPRMVKARDFFAQPNLLTPLQGKISKVLKQKIKTSR